MNILTALKDFHLGPEKQIKYVFMYLGPKLQMLTLDSDEKLQYFEMIC